MTVETCREGGWHKWESEAGEGYTVVETEKPEDMEDQGTRLTLHLKKDCLEYAKSERLEELLGKYSSFIDFPIELWTEKTEYKQVPDPEDETGEKKKTVPEKVEKWEVRKCTTYFTLYCTHATLNILTRRLLLDSSFQKSL